MFLWYHYRQKGEHLDNGDVTIILEFALFVNLNLYFFYSVVVLPLRVKQFAPGVAKG